jgi:O-antigen ligase
MPEPGAAYRSPGAEWLAGRMMAFGRRRTLAAGSAFIAAGVLAALALEQPLLLALPLGLVGLALWLVDYRPFAWLLWAATPLSLEVPLGDALSTDLPTEPLMLAGTAALAGWFVLRRRSVPWARFRHPIATALGLHLLWLLVATGFSVDLAVSAKWMAAKLWYVGAFFGLTLLLVRRPETRGGDFRTLFWLLFWPTAFTVVWTLARHAQMNFGFAEVNLSMEPFYRNHVNYAVFVALVTPLLWLASGWYRPWTWPRMVLQVAKPVFLAAVYFSYTRSAWISLVVGLAAWWLMKRDLLRAGALAALVALLGTCAWLLDNNRYLDYAPDFSKTIYHDDFADHMAATASLEDVSSAERIYRWVAGWYMFLDKPLTGFGPGNFYPHYQHYTVSSFYTYISRNEERSTVHNYYLLTLLETGLAGTLLFFTLVFTAVFTAQRAYARSRDPDLRRFLLAVTVSFVTILVNLFFSDLVEADKIGTLFYALLALILVADRAVARETTRAEAAGRRDAR